MPTAEEMRGGLLSDEAQQQIHAALHLKGYPTMKAATEDFDVTYNVFRSILAQEQVVYPKYADIFAYLLRTVTWPTPGVQPTEETITNA
jgi:hypothetical protein